MSPAPAPTLPLPTAPATPPSPTARTPAAPRTPSTPDEINRPIYVRRVPESVWIRVHENALKSRLRLQDYLVKVMADSEPFTPTPRPQPAGPPGSTST
jgi:hypothetical protein